MTTTSKSFGIPLASLLNEDKKKRPQLQVPFVVKQAVKYVIRNGFDSEGIFRLSGNVEAVKELKASLDKGNEHDFIKEKAAVNDIASLLKMYLRELPEPILGYENYDTWLKVGDMKDRAAQLQSIQTLIDALATPQKSLLTVIITMAGLLAVNQHVHKMGAGNLAKVLAPNLLWTKDPGTDPTIVLMQSQRLNDVIQIVVEEYRTFFKYGADQILMDTPNFTFLRAKLLNHKKSIMSLAKAGNTVWSCDSTGTINVWDSNKLSVLKEFDSGQGRLFSMVAGHEGQIWTGAEKNGKVWNAQTMEVVKEIPMLTYSAALVNDVMWVGGENKITLFDSTFKNVGEIPVANNLVLSVCGDWNYENVWTGNSDKTIRVYSADTNQLVKEIKHGKVNTWVATETYIWSGDDSGVISVWNPTTFEKVKELKKHGGAVYGLGYAGQFVWSCSWDTSIVIWESTTLEPVCVLSDYHSDAVSAITLFWNEDVKTWEAWSSCWDKSVTVWTLGNAQHKLPEGPLNANRGLSVELLKKKEGELESIKQEIQKKKEEIAAKQKSVAEKKDLLAKKKEEIASA